MFLLWTMNRIEIARFIEQANNHRLTIKFTAEVSETETTYLDTNISVLRRKIQERLSSWCAYTLQLRHFNIHFTSSHPPGDKKGFVKGEALKSIWRENQNPRITLLRREVTQKDINLTTLSEVKLEERKLSFLSHNVYISYQCQTLNKSLEKNSI